jgi:hypothetical protein
MAVQLVRIGDGKVAHIGIWHEGWRPFCGRGGWGYRESLKATYYSPDYSPGRKPKKVCAKCCSALNDGFLLRSIALHRAEQGDL